MRLMILPVLTGFALAALPAAARTGCDGYGRCFEFSGPSDRLADRAALWQRADAVDPSEAASGDPMALARGTIGEHLQALADDD